MSILKKISILFILCCSLVIFIGIYANNINEEKADMLNKKKFLDISKELILSLDNISKSKKIYEKYNLKKIEASESIIEHTIIYQQESSFGYIKIIKHNNNIFLQIKYLDEILLYKEVNTKLFKDADVLKMLTILNLLVLILMFIYNIRLLSPIKKISERIKYFSKGNFHVRIKVDTTKEIADLGESFNLMAEKIEDLIITREELLRNIGHELKTPISKGKFVLEKIPNSEEKEYIKKIFKDIDLLTSQLVELEKLRSTSLNKEHFDIESLIAESLGKLYINDEEKIDIKIKDNFSINADLYYLTIALKNLVENSLKYSKKIPIRIIVFIDNIIIINKSEKLKHSLDYYTKPFIQETVDSKPKGFGLGLSIVERILDKHNYTLKYRYIHGYSIFSISMNKNRISVSK